MMERIPHRLRQLGYSGDARLLLQQPRMQRFHDWPTSRLPHLSSMFGWMAANLRLDRIEIADAREHMQRERRLRRFEELVERAPQMRPAKREFDRVVLA